MGDMKLKDRFKLARDNKGFSQQRLADLVGVSQPSVQNIENGRTKKPRDLTDYARVLGVSGDWLLYGEEGKPQNELAENKGVVHVGVANSKESSVDTDDIDVPFYTEVKSTDENNSAVQVELDGPKVRFSKSTLLHQGINVENAACVMVAGNSMEPVIPDGSTVAVDREYTNIVDGEMYAIDWAGELYIKILTRRPGGGLRIRSFNLDEYPDENLSSEEAKSVRILGRVFWYSVLR